MTDPLAAGVIGTGNMGRHHARVYAALPTAELVGVSDADPASAAAVAASHDTAACTEADLLDAADVVSIAVPTRHHIDVALRAVEQGVPVLVEKPLAATAEAAESFLAVAREADVTVAVGHVERFNPAVQALLDMVDGDDVVAVDTRRLGPSRDGDHDDVVHDLMIHDLDVVQALLGDDVPFLQAATGRDGQYAAAVAGFGGGAVGTFLASRVTQQKVRELAVTTDTQHVVVDYLDQSMRIHHASEPEYVESDDGVRHLDRSVVVHPTIERAEPLRRELAAFIDAVRNGETPAVSGEDGLRALRLADRVSDAAAREAPVLETGDPA